MTPGEFELLRKLPVMVYSPTPGGGRQWASLIDNGYVSVRDVGSDEMQETILLVEATAKGKRALTSGTCPEGRNG